MDTVPFTNENLHPDYLPAVEQVDLHHMQPTYLRYSMVGTTVWLLFTLAIMLIGWWIFVRDFDQILIILLVVWSILATFSMVVSYYGCFRKKYGLRQKDILYQEGLLWQSQTIVPFNRVQHGEVTRGPIERIFGLATLELYTAGGASSDVKIPGLDPASAQRIKDFIIKQTAHDEEE